MAEAPKVLIADPLPPLSLKPLSEAGYKVDLDFKIPQEKLPEVIGNYDGVIIRSGKQMTAEVLQNPGKLRVIARAGVGYDNIDLEAATAKGIMVLNTPEGNTVAVAELTIMHMLTLARNFPAAHVSTKAGHWERSRFEGVELNGKTLGIIGVGHIGQAVAERIMPFGMRMIGYDPFVSEDAARNKGVELKSLEEVLAESDFITLHLPLLPKTRGIINKNTLALVRRTPQLINTARGELIIEEDLIGALNDGRLAGAALDVFPKDQVPDSFKDHQKINLTPHLGASTKESLDRVGEEAAVGVVDVLEGRIPRTAVNVNRILPEALRQLSPYLSVTEALGALAVWLANGKRFEEAEAYFSGEISKCSDLTVLRASLIKGLASSFIEGPVNLVNYRYIEDQAGLKIKEIRADVNGDYQSSVRIKLLHPKGATTITGIDTHGKTKIIEINDYPVEFTPAGRTILACLSVDRPGVIGEISTRLGKYEINIEEITHKASTAAPEKAMTILLLKRPLTEYESANFKELKKAGVISSFSQYIP